MKYKIIIAVLLVAMFAGGLFVGKTLEAKITKNKITELKEKDEQIFNTYRDGVDLAADALACFGNELCLQDKSSELDVLAETIDEQLDARDYKYGAEK